VDATPFTKNVPIDETPATNETADTNEAPETSEASDTNETPNEGFSRKLTPATPNITTRLEWLLRLLSLLYPNTYSYFYLYFPIHKQHILNSLDVFLAFTTLLPVEGLLVAVIADAGCQLEAGYGECGWEGT
jgi:hypothetical protein